MTYNQLQLREIFHLEFLRWLSRKAKPRNYVLKGGVNLRFFFNSFRYSEDMDLDAFGIDKSALSEAVMYILRARLFGDNLRPFGIERIVPPNMAKAKQTETTQRFKVHLITSAGENLFTKVEFSRRGFKGDMLIQAVVDSILRAYKLPPLLIPHYDIHSAVMQKIDALSSRPVVQARDIFDIYILSSQYSSDKGLGIKIDNTKLIKACENIFDVNFHEFRDKVVSYLAVEDQAVYNNEPAWDEIKLKSANFIEELGKRYA